MSSPLQGGGRRRAFGGIDSSFAPPRGRSRLARVLLVLASALAATVGWLALGATETTERDASAALIAPVPRAPGVPSKSEEAASAAVDLDRDDSLDVELEKPPGAGVLFDLDSGEVLWREDPSQELPVASLTKMMTALVVVDRAKPDREYRVTRQAIDFSGSAVGLPRGKRVEAESLLAAMLIQSGNDAATALAIGVAGSEKRFVRLMNERARKLGLDCTKFVSPDGLEPGNRSCAADLAALARLAMDEPRIRRIVRQEEAAVPFPIAGGRQHLATTNPLLKTGYAGTIGLKTGFTERAGPCLVGVVRRGGRTLGVVLIDSADPNRDARALFDRAFRAGSGGG